MPPKNVKLRMPPDVEGEVTYEEALAQVRKHLADAGPAGQGPAPCQSSELEPNPNSCSKSESLPVESTAPA